METQQTPEHGNGKVAAVLLFTLWGDFTCEYLSGCGRYHFADMILEKNKKSTCNLYTLMLNYNANAL